jgi:hypothetical protein
MEMSQGKSLCSCLQQTKISFFYFTKSENERARQVLPQGDDASRKGEEVGKECGRVNIAQYLCTHVCKWKNENC